jgi:RimJ/RimL family protein N-acetyltransferase
VPEDRPLGDAVDWVPALAPERTPLHGEHVIVRPIAPRQDPEPLFEASHPPAGDPAIWTYLPYGPYENPAELQAVYEAAEGSQDPIFFALCPLPDERPLGVASYLNINPDSGTVEIGHVWFGPELQRTSAATEAIYLLLRHAFDDLGYRRLEWKCNALNAASRRAAERFGFTFEGVFRKHMVVKGRNRDSAWYSITDDQWPAIQRGFQAWLAPENTTPAGTQRRSLSELVGEARDPASA